jgi:hypothetical protein
MIASSEANLYPSRTYESMLRHTSVSALNIMSTYELSCELVPSHADDVKSVLAISDDILATASRDQSVGIWHRKADSVSEDLLHRLTPVRAEGITLRTPRIRQLFSIHTRRRKRW